MGHGALLTRFSLGSSASALKNRRYERVGAWVKVTGRFAALYRRASGDIKMIKIHEPFNYWNSCPNAEKCTHGDLQLIPSEFSIYGKYFNSAFLADISIFLHKSLFQFFISFTFCNFFLERET